MAKTKKTTRKKYEPNDMVAVVTPSHSGLFMVVEARDADTAVVRDPATGATFSVRQDQITGGPWRPV